MMSYIFITNDGCTYQPNSDSPEPDIENCQVIGFAKGNNKNEAFENLIKQNEYLLDTTFNEIICMELKNEEYYGHSRHFYLNEYKQNMKVYNKLSVR